MKEITEQELDQFLKLATQRARDKAKVAGTSIIYEENNKMIREYADGRKTQVIRDEEGHRSEVEYAGN